MTNFTESIGQLIIDDSPVGTAWLLDRDLAITAYHCVASVSGSSAVSIRFPSATISCSMEDQIEDLDFASLRLNSTHQLSPLKIITRPVGAVSSAEWQGHGYPSGLNVYAARNNGLSLSGRVDNLFAEINGVPSIQLTCAQGANVRPVIGGNVLGGISGSPVLVTVQGQEFVVGFIRELPPLLGETVLFATAIDQIERVLISRAVQVPLASWDSFRGVPTIKKLVSGSFQSNIDLDLIKQIWEHGLKGFWCNVRQDESPILANALERILVHCRRVETRSRVDISMTGSRGWEATCRKYLKEWVPLCNFAQQDHFRELQFVELTLGSLPKGGAIYASAVELAEQIQSACNTWVLDNLRDKLVGIFADPDSNLDFTIAPDILTVMQQLWSQWLHELQNDKCLLHHFLGLMQTGDGNFDMNSSGAGVGPLTLDRCVSGPIAYTLALCAGLPSQLQLPKAARPGNVGVEGLDGHACGIELLRGRTLNSVGRTHQWRTAVVMLPFLQGEWSAFEDAHQRLDVSTSERSQSLAKEPPGPVVLPKDRELQAAIQSGLPSLRRVLELRCTKIVQEQMTYVNRATDVQA